LLITSPMRSSLSRMRSRDATYGPGSCWTSSARFHSTISFCSSHPTPASANFCTPVCGRSFTHSINQSICLSVLQNRAMRIICPYLDYSACSDSLVIAEADRLEGRRERLAQRFLRHNVLNETSYLHYLLKSQERSQDIVNRLPSSQTVEHYSVPTAKFKRCFILFSFNNYQ